MGLEDVYVETKLERGSGTGEDSILLEDYEHANHRRSSETIVSEQHSSWVGAYQKRWSPLTQSQLRHICERASESLSQSPKTFLLFLLPSFVYPWRSKTPQKPPHPTAYLDGLRGIAAFFVVTSHYSAQFAPALLEGYGSGPKANAANNKWLMQLPLLRIIVSGQFMVVLFYVMSGCVLSTRGLKLARNGKQAQFASTMASSVFRRWIRLHLPVIIAMFISMAISQGNGWSTLPRNWLSPAPSTSAAIESSAVQTVAALGDSSDTSNLGTRATKGPVRLNWAHKMAPRMGSITAQLGHWLRGVIGVCDPFRMGQIDHKTSNEYNPGGVLWTIPAEWLGSMVVFLAILGVAWTPPKVRFGTILAITIWSHLTSKWEIASFLSGMLITELMLNRNTQPFKPSPSRILIDEEAISSSTSRTFTAKTSSSSQNTPTTTNIVCIAFFTAGIYLGCLPYSYPSTSLGYITLCDWIPSWYHPASRFYLCIGSLLTLVSLTYSPSLQRIFSSAFMRYLGRISFSLYLLHAQILTTIGIPIMVKCMRFVGGGQTQSGFAVGFVLGVAILGPITIWAADVFTRGVDEQSVELAKWLAGRFLILDD